MFLQTSVPKMAQVNARISRQQVASLAPLVVAAQQAGCKVPHTLLNPKPYTLNPQP